LKKNSTLYELTKLNVENKKAIHKVKILNNSTLYGLPKLIQFSFAQLWGAGDVTLSLLEAPWQFLTELKRVLRLPHRKLSLDTEKKQILFTEMRKILQDNRRRILRKISVENFR
jgi:hypothetical protein